MAKQKEPMPSKGVRMPDEMWAKCDEMTQKLGLESRNEYIRNAIEFYTEWNERTSTQKFLTPALESVIGAKVRDSENRIARMLYKMAEATNALTVAIANSNRWGSEELKEIYQIAEEETQMINGLLDLRAFDYKAEDDEWRD